MKRHSFSPRAGLALGTLAGLALAPVSGADEERVAPRITHAVLVHGIFGNERQMKGMRKRLEQRGIHCLAPSLRPCDGSAGLEALACQLQREIDQAFGTEQRMAVIGYSMGGIVSRYYLQNLGGASRCDAFITLSSPHHGSQAAWLYPSQGAKQMRPGSVFLADLARTEDALAGIPVISYRTPLDLVIVPAASSVWERAENRPFFVAMHPLMLHSKKVYEDLEGSLLATAISHPAVPGLPARKALPPSPPQFRAKQSPGVPPPRSSHR